MGPGCLMISIVSVTVVGVEVVLALQGISRADPSLTTGYRQVFQSKLPVTPYNIIYYYVYYIMCYVSVTIKPSEEDSLPAVHVVVTLPYPVRLLQPERLGPNISRPVSVRGDPQYKVGVHTLQSSYRGLLFILSSVSP